MKLLDILNKYSPVSVGKGQQLLRNEVLAGVLVALTLIPESVAFSIVAGVRPVTSIVTTCTMLFIPAMCNGRPGMMSGAAGAVAVVTRQLVFDHGENTLFLAVALCGVIQMALSFAPSVESTLRMIPVSVVSGFTSGLSILILKSQFHHFQSPEDPMFSSTVLYTLVGLVSLQVVDRFRVQVVPPPLVAVVVVTTLSLILDLPTTTVSDAAGSLESDTALIHFPSVQWSWTELIIVLPYSLTVSCIGITETVLTMQVLDKKTQTRGSISGEVFGQGLANFLGGMLLGCQGGCAMLVPSTLNFNSGGRTHVSVIACGVAILAFLLLGSAVLAIVPLAALCAVLVDVCIHIFDWKQITSLHRLPRVDAVSTLVVLVLTITTNLAVGALAGVVVNSLWWAVHSGRQVKVDRIVESLSSNQQMVRYKVKGPIFWGSAANIQECFTPSIDETASRIVLELDKPLDQTGKFLISGLREMYRSRGLDLETSSGPSLKV